MLLLTQGAAAGGAIDPTALVMALSGAITAVAGIWLSRSGQRDTARQQVAASALAGQVHEHNAYRDLTGDLRAEIERLHAVVREQQAQYDAGRAQSARTISELGDTIRVLRSVVLSEAAKAIGVPPSAIDDLTDDHTD